MSLTRLCLAVIACLAAMPATAQQMTDSTGLSYVVTCNKNGAVLSPADGGPPVYLGRSCDAWSDRLGPGHWGGANGGVRADFSRGALGFQRQEVNCPADGPQPDMGRCPL